MDNSSLSERIISFDTVNGTDSRLASIHPHFRVVPCRYDHLSDVVHFALANRANDVMAAFEETSRMLRERRHCCSSARARAANKSDTFQFALQVCQSLKVGRAWPLG